MNLTNLSYKLHNIFLIICLIIHLYILKYIPYKLNIQLSVKKESYKVILLFYISTNIKYQHKVKKTV